MQITCAGARYGNPASPRKSNLSVKLSVRLPLTGPRGSPGPRHHGNAANRLALAIYPDGDDKTMTTAGTGL
jgi:hypothetical protein